MIFPESNQVVFGLKPDHSFTTALSYHEMAGDSFFNSDFLRFVCGIYPAAKGALNQEFLQRVEAEGRDKWLVYVGGLVLNRELIVSI